MGRPIIASSCSHFRGTVPAQTAGSGTRQQLLGTSPGEGPARLVQGVQDLGERHTPQAGCRGGSGQREKDGDGTFYRQHFFPDCFRILRLPGHPEYLGELIAKNSLWTSLMGRPLVLLGAGLFVVVVCFFVF